MYRNPRCAHNGAVPSLLRSRPPRCLSHGPGFTNFSSMPYMISRLVDTKATKNEVSLSNCRLEAEGRTLNRAYSPPPFQCFSWSAVSSLGSGKMSRASNERATAQMAKPVWTSCIFCMSA